MKDNTRVRVAQKSQRKESKNADTVEATIHQENVQHMGKHNEVKPCRFFAVPWNDSGLLGIQDIKILGILSVQCTTIESRGHSREIHKQRTEVLCKLKFKP